MTNATAQEMPLMRIGEVAAQSGVSVQALRYYERRGLLHSAARRASGYRGFDPDTVRLVRFVKQAQELGFTLDELEDLLRLRTQVSESKRDAGDSVRAAIVAKLDSVDRKMRQLKDMRDALAELIAICDENCSPGTPVSDARFSKRSMPESVAPTARTLLFRGAQTLPGPLQHIHHVRGEP